MERRIGALFQCVGAISAVALSAIAAVAGPIEQIAALLPANAKVLLVPQGLYHEHPQCPVPIAGDASSLTTLLVGQLGNGSQQSRTRKGSRCVVWNSVEPDPTRETRHAISAYARARGITRVLYFQATKKYRWGVYRQTYTLRVIDWTFRLHDLEKDQTRIVQGLETADESSFNGHEETIPVACPRAHESGP